MAEDVEAVVRRYSELVEERDWDGLREHVTDDFVVHEPESIDSEPHDIEGHIEVLKAFEWRIEVKDIFSSGNKVASREVIYGTQINEFEGLPPSGEEISASSILIWEVEDGKVSEVWSSPDSHTFLEGLGLTFPQILLTLPKVLVRKVLP